MDSITIDNIGIQAHTRYAKDRALLDPIFLTEPQIIAPHIQNKSLSSIYSSKWEELFDIQKRNMPWASFAPPPSFFSAPPYLFSLHTFFFLFEEGDQEKEQKKEQEEEPDHEMELRSNFQKKKKALTKLLDIKRTKEYALPLFEKDRTSILSLLEAIEQIDQWLVHIHARKHQYQKG